MTFTMAARRSQDLHREVYTAEADGEAIHIACDCHLDRDHTYADWRADIALRRELVE